MLPQFALGRDIPEQGRAWLDIDELDDFSRENRALSPWWMAVNTGFSQIRGGGKAIPDISKWIDGTLVLSPKAFDLLEEHLAPFGEFLCVFNEGEKFCIFNCLTMVDADPKHSQLDEHDIPSQLEFTPEATEGKLVFKTAFDGCYSLYCSNQFVDLIRQSMLTGIRFEENLTRLAYT